MTTIPRQLVLLLAAFSLSATLTGAALAQNPFQPADPGAANPFGRPAAPAADPADPAAVPAPADAPPEETDPIVLMIRDRDPQAPRELIQAVQLLMKIGRADEAKAMLARLLDAAPDDEALAALQREFGSGLFFRMVRQKDLHPEGLIVAESVLHAAQKAVRDPARLRSLAADLSADDPAVRRAALVDLREAGADAVAPLVEILGDDRRSGEHEAAKQALVGLGAEAVVDPLVAWLNAPNEALRVHVLEAIAQIGDSRTALFLFRPLFSPASSDEVRAAARGALVSMFNAAPDRAQAAYLLHKRVLELHGGAPYRQADHENMLEIWSWDQDAAAPARRRLPAGDAALLVEAQLAEDLYSIAPEQDDSRKLYLAARLEVDKILGGIDAPLATGEGSAHDAAAAAGVEAMEEVLAFSVETKHTAAAIAAAEVLGNLGEPLALAGDRGRPGPLAAALTHADRRVRFAAAQAILQIDPAEPYPGASLLIDELVYFASASAARGALVADPRSQEGQTLVGMLAELDREADSALTGKAVLQAARNNPDYELILVSDAIDAPPVNELMQLLRRDWRTASIPIGLVAQDARIDYCKRIADADPLMEAFPPPPTTAFLAEQTRRLLELAGRNATPVEERMAQAVWALDALGRFAADPQRYAFYDIQDHRNAVNRALYTPELSVRAAEILGVIGDAEAQRELVEYASQPTRDIASRRAAADAFDSAVKQRGLWLTQQQILQQYERYNRSEDLDKDTQTVLSKILDAIERPASQANSQAEQAPQPNPAQLTPSES